MGLVLQAQPHQAAGWPNNRMQVTALRAAADAERRTWEEKREERVQCHGVVHVRCFGNVLWTRIATCWELGL